VTDIIDLVLREKVLYARVRNEAREGRKEVTDALEEHDQIRDSFGRAFEKAKTQTSAA
jgi:hypothetical protein